MGHYRYAAPTSLMQRGKESRGHRDQSRRPLLASRSTTTNEEDVSVGSSAAACFPSYVGRLTCYSLSGVGSNDPTIERNI